MTYNFAGRKMSMLSRKACHTLRRKGSTRRWSASRVRKHKQATTVDVAWKRCVMFSQRSTFLAMTRTINCHRGAQDSTYVFRRHGQGRGQGRGIYDTKRSFPLHAIDKAHCNRIKHCSTHARRRLAPLDRDGQRVFEYILVTSHHNPMRHAAT
jgi:hypothetical protein